MKNKELNKKVEELLENNSKKHLSNYCEHQEINEKINLLTKLLKLEFKKEDYIGEEIDYRGSNIIYYITNPPMKKVVKQRLVLSKIKK